MENNVLQIRREKLFMNLGAETSTILKWMLVKCCGKLWKTFNLIITGLRGATL
jgi:hypothetical protein